MRAMPTAEKLDDVAKATVLWRLLIIGVDSIFDALLLVAIGATGKDREPRDQEMPVCRRIRQLERVEPGWNAGTEHIVAPGDRTDEEFGAAIHVEEGDARSEFQCLS